MYRPRTNLLTPKTPGGFLDNPPEGCPKAVCYNPKPSTHESVMLVEYVRCERCSIAKKCTTKLAADKEARKRIRSMKNGEAFEGDD